MVIKTVPCSFSEFNIYPGHGVSYVRRDGTPYVFITGKARCMYNQRKKPMKLKWTCAWRKLHKKRTEHRDLGKKTRKIKKVERAVMGTDFAAIKARRNETSAQRDSVKKAAGGKAPTYGNAIKYVPPPSAAAPPAAASHGCASSSCHRCCRRRCRRCRCEPRLQKLPLPPLPMPSPPPPTPPPPAAVVCRQPTYPPQPAPPSLSCSRRAGPPRPSSPSAVARRRSRLCGADNG